MKIREMSRQERDESRIKMSDVAVGDEVVVYTSGFRAATYRVGTVTRVLKTQVEVEHEAFRPGFAPDRLYEYPVVKSKFTKQHGTYVKGSGGQIVNVYLAMHRPHLWNREDMEAAVREHAAYEAEQDARRAEGLRGRELYSEIITELHKMTGDELSALLAWLREPGDGD